MSSILVGSTRVDVVPDASRFNERLKAALANLPDVTVNVDADVTKATARIDELTRPRTATVNVDLDAAGATARIDELTRNRTETVNVDADTAGASVHIDELTRRRDATVNVDVDTGAAEAKIAAVGASARESQGGMSGLLAAGLALGPGIIPVAGAAAVAILGIGAAALSAGPALGALFLGFSGVAGAVGALGKADASSAATGAASAAARVAQTNSIINAQASLTNAQRTAAASAISSAQAVVDAERGVADAKRAGAQAIATAVQTEMGAERALGIAQDSERMSQLALTQARVSAKQAMEDLTNAVADGALSQRQATLNVEQARLSLSSLGPTATSLQRRQAQLAYDQAVQQVTDLATRQARLVADKKAADKAGVNGSASVVAAQANVTKSITGTATAQAALVRAEAGVTEARRASAEKVTVAQEAVTKALAAQANTAASSAASIASAQRQVQQAMEKTATAGAAAGTALQTAMSKLSPAGQDFARFLYSLKPEFDKLKATSQGELLPGVTKFFQALTPLMPVFNQIIGNASKALGDLFASAGKALQAPFWRDFFKFLADTVGPNITIFGQILGDLATGFAALLTAFAPVGDKVMGVIAGLATSFADWAKSLSGSSGFQAFMVYMKENGPKVWGLLGDLLTVSGKLLVGLAPLGAVILDVLGWLASTLAKMSPGQITAVATAVGLLIAALSQNWVAAAIIAVGGLISLFAGGGGVQGVGEKISAALPGVKAKLAEWGAAFVAWVKVAWPPMRDELVKLLAAFEKWLYTVALPAIGAQLVKWGKAFVEWVGPMIPDLLIELGKVLGAMGKWQVDTAMPWLGEHLAKWGYAFWEWVKPAIGPMLIELGKLLLKLTVWIITAALPHILDKLGQWGLAFVKWVPSAALGMIVELGKLQVRLVSWMAVSTLPAINREVVKWEAAFLKWVSDTTTALPSRLTVLLAVIVRWAAGVPAGITKALGDLTKLLVQKGKDVLEGLWVGMVFVWNKITGWIGTIATWIKAHKGPLSLDAKLLTPHGTAIMQGFWDGLQAGFSTVKAGVASMGSQIAAGAAQWLPLVQQALTMLGQPVSLSASVLRRINFESGGNPNAINLTDSNAKAGHPSQGLMQTIPGTFAAYAGPLVGRGITDPLANIYAGLNYALHTYGSITAIDPLNRPTGYDMGGMLLPGGVGQNRGQLPERVLSGSQTASFERLVASLDGSGSTDLLTALRGIQSTLEAMPKTYQMGSRQYA